MTLTNIGTKLMAMTTNLTMYDSNEDNEDETKMTTTRTTTTTTTMTTYDDYDVNCDDKDKDHDKDSVDRLIICTGHRYPTLRRT